MPTGTHCDNGPSTFRPFDMSDRMLLPAYLKMIESLTRPFTLDACANKDGSNKQCDNYCHIDNSFLLYNCSGHHVWLNPPYQHGQYKTFLLRLATEIGKMEK